MMNKTFTERLQFEQNYKGGDCETIHSNELQSEELPMEVVQFGEIEDLRNSIAKFIAIYSQKNLPHDENAYAKVLEWQKRLSNEQLAITDGIGAEVKTETPTGHGKGNRREPTAKSRISRTARRELIEVKKQLQQERMVTKDLEERLKTAHNARQRNIELASTLKSELGAAKAENEIRLQKEKTVTQTLREKVERICSLEKQLIDLGTALKRADKGQEELEKTKQDLEDLNQNMKSSRDEAYNRLDTSKDQILRLKNYLKAANSILNKMHKKFVIDNDDNDERINALRSQLFETRSLIDLEKKKAETEAERSRIQAVVAKAKTSSSQDIGELLKQEECIKESLLQIEEKMVNTRLEVLRYAKHKLRFENSKIRPQESVNYVPVEDFTKKFEELRGQIVYCFVNKIMTVVELGKYKDFLVNPKHLADNGEFFYCSHGLPRKRRRELNDTNDKDTSNKRQWTDKQPNEQATQPVNVTEFRLGQRLGVGTTEVEPSPAFYD
ncbi:2a454805-7ebb-4649-95af-311ffb030764 [Sclerotinia trifoliorum]|uniref:2a454805-7ebb-4649-95af-311ffb030764 n=1 Tax=Sclerotinia trifoliorum TaxID=28548 RepID=A0A8H2VY35_9HELO|nr:2a454805-7ebb-4649-95af-311ffb030764 [Sclerotinia trifoliorum]